VECFESYGFHEVQWVSVECPAHDGLHIFEDAFVVQVVDPETGEPVPDGELGALCITELYKTGSPQFRYNIMDLSALYPRERCSCGSWLRKMAPFAGRGDNMVKLRGVNVWPEAVGELAMAVDGVAPDWFVRAVRRDGRDELIVTVVSERDPSSFPDVADAVEQRLKERLGVRIPAEVVAPGALDAWTEVGVSPKLKRFRDER
jgi:phenylacetate-CoA ligase